MLAPNWNTKFPFTEIPMFDASDVAGHASANTTAAHTIHRFMSESHLPRGDASCAQPQVERCYAS